MRIERVCMCKDSTRQNVFVRYSIIFLYFELTQLFFGFQCLNECSANASFKSMMGVLQAVLC